MEHGNGTELGQKNKSAVEGFCHETGFRNAGNRILSPIVRAIWLVFVCVAALVLIYDVAQSAIKFTTYPVNTKFYSVDKSHLEFPAITLCNVNLFRSDKLAKLYGGYEPLMTTGLPQLRQLFPQMRVIDEPMPPLDDNYPEFLDLGEFITSNTHKLEDMLVKCTFNGEPCNSDNFTTIVTNYGICYSYNKKRPAQKINQAGQRRGLSLILNAQHKLYVAAPRENAGFKVLAHDVDEVPNMEDHGKGLQTGTHVEFGLERSESFKLSAPYGNCRETADYTHDKCFLDCQTKYVVAHCNCRTFYMSGDAPFCSSNQLLDCVNKKMGDFNSDRYVCECPPACKQNIFRAFLSQTTYPSLAVPSALQANKKWHFVALGFGDKVTTTVFPLLDTELYDERNSLYDAIAGLTNSEGVTFLDFTSSDIVTRVHNGTTEEIFRNVPYDIYDSMGDKLFYDVGYEYDYIDQGSYEYIGPGSQYYREQADLSFANYVSTRILKDILQESLSAGTATGPIDVSNVYEQFGFEDFFYEAFNVTFNGVYSLMKEVAERDVIPTLDLTRVTTEYMRSNLVYVDIFYEDLKVATTQDQAEYEIYKLMRDLGGSLGIFVGISLLSFIAVFACCSKIKQRST